MERFWLSQLQPGWVAIAVSVTLLLCSGCEPSDFGESEQYANPNTPGITVGIVVPEISKVIDNCAFDLFLDAKSMSVYVYMVNGEQWGPTQTFRKFSSTTPYPPSQIRVPSRGAFKLVITYRLGCNSCMCGQPDLGPILKEEWSLLPGAAVYTAGSSPGGITFDHCDDCF